jgi:hypothetical protein
MTAEEHNAQVSEINKKFTARAITLGVNALDVASHLVNKWTNGKTSEYMRWFQDQNFDTVLKPEGLDIDQLSDAEICEAVRGERVRIIGEWLPKMDTLTLDGSESGTEVSVPEVAPVAPVADDEDDDMAEALAKLKKKKEEGSRGADAQLIDNQGKLLGEHAIKLEQFDGDIKQLTIAHNETSARLDDAIKVISKQAKKLDLLLTAIKEL